MLPFLLDADPTPLSYSMGGSGTTIDLYTLANEGAHPCEVFSRHGKLMRIQKRPGGVDSK